MHPTSVHPMSGCLSQAYLCTSPACISGIHSIGMRLIACYSVPYSVTYFGSYFGCRLSAGCEQQPVMSVSPGLLAPCCLPVILPLGLPLFLAYTTVVNLRLADRTRMQSIE